MVNFKYIGLPLLLGVLGPRVLAQESGSVDVPGCKITVTEGEEGYTCEPGNQCDSSTDGGYHLVEVSSAGTNGNQITTNNVAGTVVKLTYDPDDTSANPCKVYTTPGYYYLSDEKYIQCDYNGICVMKDTPTTASCGTTTADIGKIIAGPSLCIGAFRVPTTQSPLATADYKSLALKVDDREDDYFVQHSITNSTVFSFDDDANYYAVKAISDAILFDSTLGQDGVKEDLASLTSGIRVSRKKEHCSTDASGKYYTCQEGICTSKAKGSQVNDSNGETLCKIEYSSSAQEYKYKTGESGCVKKKDGYYFLDTTAVDAKEITNTSAGKYVKVEGNKFTILGPKSNVASLYFYNKALSSKGTYPLVSCNASTCNLSKAGPANKNYFLDGDDASLIIKSNNRYVNDPTFKKGYYFNDDYASGVSCDGSKCVVLTNASYYTNCNSKSIGGVRLDTTTNKFLFCISYDERKGEPVELEFSASKNDVGTYIVNAPAKFPGIAATTEPILVEKKGSMINVVEEGAVCTYDGQIVKKEDKFIYCASVVKTVTTKITTEEDGGTTKEVKQILTPTYADTSFLFEKDGAEFVHKVGSTYKVVKLEANGFTYVKGPRGYYLDRSGKTINVVQKDNDDPVSDEDKYKSTTIIYCDGVNCNPVDAGNLREHDFFANAEKKHVKDEGSIIQCVVKEVQEEDVDPYYECTVEEVDAGYYTNHKSELIQCTDGECDFTDGVKYKKVTSVSDIDYYLNGDGEETINKLIQCTVGEGCITIAPITSEYLTSCYTETAPEGNTDMRKCSTTFRFVNGGEKNYAIIECEVTYAEGAIAKSECKSKTSSVPYVYYVSEEYDKAPVGRLIKCFQNERCEYGTVDDSGSFINANNDKNVITCISGDACINEEGINYYSDGYQKGLSLIYCKGSASCGQVSGSVRDVFISGKEKLLHFDGERFVEVPITPIPVNSCTAETEAQEYYYMNGGSDKKDKPLIKLTLSCVAKAATSRKRQEVTYESKVILDTVAGSRNQLYSNSNSDGLHQALIYCTDTKVCGEINADDGDWYVDVDGKKLYKCKEEDDGCSAASNMELLVTSGKTYGFLIDATSGKVLSDNNVGSSRIIKCSLATAEGSNIECAEVTSGPNYYVNPRSSTSLFYIDGSNNVGIIAAATKGYYNLKTAGNVIECTDTECKLFTASECQEGKVYSEKICLANNAQGSNGKKYITRLVDTPNSLVNFKSAEVVLLEKPKVDEYYLTSDAGDILESGSSKNLYKCTTAGTCTSQTLAKGVFLNGDVSGSGKPYIVCSETTCELTDSTSNEYCLYSNALYSCSDGCKEQQTASATACTKVTAKNGLYVPYANDKLIKCSSATSCNIYGNNNKETFYISADVNKPLIQCKKSLKSYVCFYVDVASNPDGYYIGTDDSNNKSILINCTGKVCTKMLNPNGFFVGGDTKNGRLIYCSTFASVSNCYQYANPTQGYFINAVYSSSDGNKLIKCDATTCKEVKAPGVGYVLNAGKSMGKSDAPMISVDGDPSEKQSTYTSTKYYNSAEKKNAVIKCISNTCESEDVANPGWYRLENSDEKLIGCRTVSGSIVCDVYDVSNLGNGYYYNAGQGMPLFYVYGNGFDMEDATAHSYYVNGDSSSSENVIACVTEWSCSLQTAETSTCSDSNAGKLSTGHGGLVYCKGGEGIKYEKLVDADNIVMVLSKNIPGMDVQDHYVPMLVGKENVVHQKINGYEYSNKKMYLCKADKIGSCVDKTAEIKDGYYFRYAPIAKIWRCESGTCEEFIQQGRSSIDSAHANVYIYNDKIYLHTEDVEVRLEELDITYLYALKTYETYVEEEVSANENLGYPFPGKKNRYILADVSKYTALFRADIGELSTCKDDNEETEDVYCIKNNKIYAVKNVGSPITAAVNVLPETGEKASDIKYGFETNDGYLMYDKDSMLTQVYIVIDKNSKYHCKINGLCIVKPKTEKPPKAFKDNNGALIRVDLDDKESVIEDSIKNGMYLTENGFIQCKEGFCQTTASPYAGLENNNGVFKYNGLESTTETKMFLVAESVSSRKRAVGNTKVFELTNASFTVTNGARNLFLDAQYQIISNGDSAVKYFYKCTNDACESVTTCSDEYYLNTVQTDKGEGKNALVHCKGNTFTFIHCSEQNGEQIYENGAADNESNAVIKCNANTCAVDVVSVDGLPECKEISSGCARADTEKLLSEGQYCYDTVSKMIKTAGDQCRNRSSSNDEIVIFDATLRELADKKRNHYGASMYKCNGNGQCYRTYGYAVDGVNVLKCVKGGCVQIENIGSKCSLVGAGNIIKDTDGKIKVCSSADAESARAIPTNTSENVYPVTVSTTGDFPEMESGSEILIGVKKEGVYAIKDDKYVLYNSDTKIIVNGSSQSGQSLYLCEGESWKCVKVDSPENGYYLSNFLSGLVIKSVSGVLSVVPGNNIEFSVDYYKYYENDAMFGGESVITRSDGKKIVIQMFNNYALLSKGKLAEIDEVVNVKEGSENGLFRCNPSVGNCNKIDGVDGWYLMEEKAIRCESERCTIKNKFSKSCGKLFGEVIYNKAFKLCCNDGTKTTSKAYDLKAGDSHKIINRNSNADIDFPNHKNYIVVDNDALIGLGIIDDKGVTEYLALPTCTTSNCAAGKKDEYCKCEKSGKVMIMMGNTNDVNEQQYVKGKNVVVFNGSKLVSETELPTIGSQMFSCIDGNCSITQGYYKVGSKYFNCMFTGCSEVGATATVAGQLTTSGVLKTSTGTGGFGSSTENYYYYIEGNNEFPGSVKYESFLVEAGEKYMVINTDVGRYLIDSNGKKLITDTQEPEETKSKRDIIDDVSEVIEEVDVEEVSDVGEVTGIPENDEGEEIEFVNEIDEVNAEFNRRIYYGTMYYCDGSKCLKQSSPSDGYYFNSAATKNSAIIECIGGNCYIAENVKFDTANCNNSTDGTLIRDARTLKNGVYTYKDYSLCLPSGPVKLSSTGSESTKLMTLTKGSKFLSIDLSGDEVEADEKLDIILKFSSQGVEQFSKSGYILTKSETDYSVVTAVSNSQTSILYYCSGSPISCEKVKMVNNGWYFNSELFGDNRYIKCLEKCNVAAAEITNKCTESGSIIYYNGSHKLCVTRNSQVDIGKVGTESIIMEVSSNKVFPGVDTANVKILIEIGSNSVQYIKENSYVVTTETSISKNTVTKNDSVGKLYKCLSGNCEEEDIPMDGYYLKYSKNGKADQLVYCSDSSCRLETEVNEGFYVAASKDKPLIQCVTPGQEIEKVFYPNGENTECYERDYAEGWYLGGNVPLIECTNELGCVAKEVVREGWYLNNEYLNKNSYKIDQAVSNRTVYDVIKCASSVECEPYKYDMKKYCDASNKSTAESGDIIYTSSSYKLCRSKDKVDNKVVPLVELKNAEGELYVVTISSEESFKKGTLIVQARKRDVTIVSDDEEKMYLIDSVLYKCSSGECEKTENPTTEEVRFDSYKENLITFKNNNWAYNKDEGFIFIGAEETLITDPEVSDVSKLYNCRKEKTLKCYDMEEEDGIPNGFYYNSKTMSNGKSDPKWYGYDGSDWKVIKDNKKEIQPCTKVDYKTNVCYISYDNEGSGSEGKELASGEICIHGDDIYLAIDEINTGIGDTENCIKIDTKKGDSIAKYYSVGGSGDVYSLDKFGVYKVNGVNKENVIDSLTAKVMKYERSNVNFKGFIKPYDYGVFDNKLINCQDGNCKIDNANSCTYNFKTGKCNFGGKVGEVCVSELGNVYVMKAVGTNNEVDCLRYDGSAKSKSEEGGMVVDGSGNYSVIDGKMYYVDSEQVVHIEGDGMYVLDNADRKVTIQSKMELNDSVYKVTVCNAEGCKVRDSCGKGSLNEYIYDSGVLYHCDPSKNVLEKVDIANSSAGYYLNSPWNGIVKCYSNYLYDIECIGMDAENGMEGYYKDSGNEGQVIKCVRENGSFKCDYEEMVKCEYDDGKCTAEVELLRNSYCYSGDKSNMKLMYVENYIRKGDSGDCIVSGTTDQFFVYKKSKFLGHAERNDLIKVNDNSIVSIYEKDVGYYIVSTSTGKGLTTADEKEFNKTRMYKCVLDVCEEVGEPVDGNIYVNKASLQRLVEYDAAAKQWNVIDQRCEIRSENENQCIVNKEIGDKGVIYLTDEIETKLYISKEVKSYLNSKNSKNYMITPENEYSLTKYEELEKNMYQYVAMDVGVPSTAEDSTDKKLYYYHMNGQVLEIGNEQGYYMFDGEGDVTQNMIGSNSNRNVTTVYKMLEYEDGIYKKTSSMDSLAIGYYKNNADSVGGDKAKKGIYLQVMDIVDKPEDDSSEGNSRKKREEGTATYKFINNLCTSVKKNVCVNTQGSKIQKGEACVVREGDFTGIYLATKEITNSSKDENCIKYDEEDVYFYVKENDIKEFAAEKIANMILKVTKTSINKITKNEESEYDGSLYVIGNTDKKILSSTKEVQATGYICKDKEVEEGDAIFECVEESKKNRYYYSDVCGGVVYSSASGWKLDNSVYAFWNKNITGVKYTDDKDEQKEVIEAVVGTNVALEGVYINGIADSGVNVIVKDSGTPSLISKEDLKECKIENANTGKCSGKTSAVEMENGSTCIDGSGKLYLIKKVTKEGSEDVETYCYTGSKDSVTYQLIESDLYRLDGNSVQHIEDGYYVLNKNNKAFTSTYPEEPEKVIECSYGSCSEVEEKKIQGEVIINKADNKLLKVYSDAKYVSVSQKGYYFISDEGVVKVYVLMDDGTLVADVVDGTNEYTVGGKKYSFEFADENIYLNNAGMTFNRGDGTEFTDELLKYSVEKDAITYNGLSNENENKNVFMVNENTLYKLMRRQLVQVDSGLYVIDNNVPFADTEWTKLDDSSILCYNDDGKCNAEKLNDVYKKKKYIINKATEKLSIVEHDVEEDSWRVVDEDGYYFFFEDEYSISSSDNRVETVLQVENGNVIDVTDRANAEGFYLFEGLMIEGNSLGWEDAQKTNNNVFVNEGNCEAYEPDVDIDNGNLCYSGEGGVCVLRNTKQGGVVSNCRFTDNESKYYYLKDDQLYVYNKKSFQKVKRSGLIVVDRVGGIMQSKIESVGNAFRCVNGKCTEESEFDNQYYLNMFNEDEDSFVILRYNKDHGLWAKTDVDGYYFFNKNGNPVEYNEEVAYGFLVKNNGGKVINVGSTAMDGVYVDNSNVDKEIVVERKSSWGKANKVPKCKYDKVSKVVTSSEVMKNGSLCLDGKDLIVIKSTKVQKSDNENEYSGISASDADGLYNYDEKAKVLEVVGDGVLVDVDITGYAVIDKSTYEPVSGEKDVPCDVYKCASKKCEVASTSKLKYIINELSEESKLIEINGGNCKVVTDQGYYFFDENLNAVGKDGRVGKAYDIGHGQTEMSFKNDIGVLINKVSKEKIAISSNGNYWSAGSEINKCNVTVTENGAVCKTLRKEDVYEKGAFCISVDNIELYVLTDAAEFESENVNCVSGSNEDPLFVKDITEFNGVNVNGKLLQLTDDAIKFVYSGIYVIDEKGMIVRNTTDLSVQKFVYKCTNGVCDILNNLEGGNVLLTSDDKMYVIDKENSDLYLNVEDEGIYFFNNGESSSIDNNGVTDIIRVSNVTNVIVYEKLKLDELAEGAYVNSADENVIAFYDGTEWTFTEKDCEYDSESGICNNVGSDVSVGDVYNSDGIFYVVYNITEDEEVKCYPGSNESPVHVVLEDKIVVVKEKSMNYWTEDGHYAIQESNHGPVVSENSVSSIFIKCESGQCVEDEPDVGRYINKSVEGWNIVIYPDGEAGNAEAYNKKCTVGNDQSCVSNDELVAGDVCIASSSIYLVASEGKCVKSEKSLIKYQFVSNKLYMLNDDSVLEKSDGYYFIGSDSRAIINREDYAKKGTKGYICNALSLGGKCSPIKYDKMKYLIDYNTKEEGRFIVVKYEPNKKSKREEEGEDGSEFSSVDEEGIYKTDDGYVECEADDEGKVTCHEIDEEGTKMTEDGELFICKKEEEDEEVVCSQETKGGYYVVDGELYDCEVNDDKDGLDCKEMDKEGYFLSNPDDVLYECVEKEETTNPAEEQDEVPNDDISRMIKEVNADKNGDGIDSDVETPIDSDDENTSLVSDTTTSTDTETSTEHDTESSTTTTTTTTEDSTTSETPTPTSEVETPLDVECKPVECKEEPIKNDDGKVLYICRKTEDEEKWEPQQDCSSGNFIKVDDDFYSCEDEDEKGEIPEENVEKPNKDHTIAEPEETTTDAESTTSSATETDSTTEGTTTAEPETSTTASEEESTTTTEATTTTMTTNAESSTTTTTETTKTNTAENTSTTTTTTETKSSSTTTTTTTKPTDSSDNKDSGASSLLRNIPSIFFYLILFSLSYILFI